MDFMVGLWKTTKGSDLIWIMVDKLTKSAHFISIKISYPFQKLTEIYISDIMKLYGIPFSIILDRDIRFTSRFYESFKKALGTKLRLSSTYRPQTDCQTEKTI